ncbi:restriction endonuclease subunit S [Bacillus safensis]|uniref:restriction endonuclease subunit S n=1 Tax=Bacillus safensis TaxID=561879 RepID=UPI002FFEDAA6
MNAQDLKNGILQLAIQGKLVEQQKEEGTVKELLQQVKVEKDQLIKEGKIKKEKKLQEITQDEIPFDIPDSWQWMRLGSVLEIARGGSPRPIKSFLTDSNDGINWIKIGDTDKGGKYINQTNEKIIKEGLKKSRYVKKGDFLLSNSMSFGRPYILNIDGCIHDGWLVLSQFIEVFNKEFLYYLLSSRMVFNQFSSRVSGAVVNNLNSDKVRLTLVPIPPLEEQKRIVEKIEELMPYVEKYDKAYSEVGELNKKFPEDMQKSILQYAIQGKLVEQREEEGTAEELYQQIQEEKKVLVKEGKVKKPKKLMRITEDEIPYDIPENWKWIRLGDIFEINPRNTVNDDTTVSFIPMTLIEDGYRSEFSYETKSWGEVKKGYTHFREGDIVMAKITPCFQNLKSAIMLNLENGVGAGTTELHVLRAYNDICLEFFLWFIKSPTFVSTCVSKMTGTAGQQRVGTDTITNYVAPLPPLEEQRRIVLKIEEMLPHCRQLIK